MSHKLGLFLTGNASIRRGLSCLFNLGELSSDCGASRLGASCVVARCLWGELSCFFCYLVELICSLFYVLFILEQIIFSQKSLTDRE